MPIYETARYRVHAAAVDMVKEAIAEFVSYVSENEPGTRMYASWQQADDPTRFVHLFIFEDDTAHDAHGQSEAVRRFESIYGPELVDGPVVFTTYDLVADKRGGEKKSP
jgi:quinol monooxygenase YgiN